MRVAVLADVHGNLPALEAVLADVARAGVDAVVLNGDLADGPFPAETLDLLATLGDRAVWVRGNGDRWLAEAYDGTFRRTGGPADDVVEWAATSLSREHRDRLASLPLAVSLDVDGVGRVAFCHASARSDEELLLVTTALDRLAEALDPLDAPTIVVGHTHMPFDRLADRRRVVNAGSVGMPYGHTAASWALLGPDVVLRRTGYDLDAAAARIVATGMPGARELALENVCRTPSDAEALAVFGPTAL